MFLRTHVFLPLVRHARMPALGALVTTALVSSLWHGLGWTFLVWGIVQAFLLIWTHYERKVFPFARPRGLKRQALIARTFLVQIFVCVLFRAPSLKAAGVIFSAMFGFGAGWVPSAGVFDWGEWVLLSFA